MMMNNHTQKLLHVVRQYPQKVQRFNMISLLLLLQLLTLLPVQFAFQWTKYGNNNFNKQNSAQQHSILFVNKNPSSSPQDTVIKKTTMKPSNNNNNNNKIQKLIDWCNECNIQISKSYVSIQNDIGESSGLGWYCTKDIPSGSIILSVPSNVAITVETPGGDGPNNRIVIDKYGKDIIKMPWFVQLSLYLNILKEQPIQQNNINYVNWINTLPISFNTPFHWNDITLQQLQYDYLIRSVQQQQKHWEYLYNTLPKSLSLLSYNDFVWGCECSRSRSFSGMFSGTGFNPSIYSFVLLLMTLYVGLDIGTIEQAANGGGLVISFSILKDFVLPKLFKKKRYVICPLIDIANHQSSNYQADVSYEFFLNTYSLAISKPKETNSSDNVIKPGEQIYISYGPRSNDQLLQYYGFVENNNMNDVYIMPPLRDWDITEIEKSCGRQIVSGRLALLEKANLLGGNVIVNDDDNSNDNSNDNVVKGNNNGGVIITGKDGIDPIIMQAIRVLIATNDEWISNGESINNFNTEYSGGQENEKCSRLAVKGILQQELNSKPTTIQHDISLLNNKMRIIMSPEEELAIQFRIEKKKLLQNCIDKYQ